jgi:peptidoglycan/xylan/chitin deacetylase (PgdA/CDA1 family)
MPMQTPSPGSPVVPGKDLPGAGSGALRPSPRASRAGAEPSRARPLAVSARQPIPILLYHSVCPAPPPDLRRWSVTPQTFDAHLGLIRELGLAPLTVSQLVALQVSGGEVPENTVVVTFDDGYADFAEHAVSILERHGVPATLYLTTGALGEVRDPVVPRMPIAPMLALSQLPGLERRGVELGAHGHGHWQLDAVPPSVAAFEIERSKEVIEEAIGHEVHSFAYPHGYSSAKVRRLVTRAGFSSACAVRNAFSSPGDNVLALARLTVEIGTPLDVLREWLSGRGAPVAARHEQLKTQVGRWYRRAVALSDRPARQMAQVTSR